MLNLALIGFGNVNRALVKHLEHKRQELLEQHGLEYCITGVYSRRLGFVCNPAGLDVQALLHAGIAPNPQICDVVTWLEACQANVLFEASSLEPRSGQPAISYLQAALEHGIHAISANKGPVVHAHRQLEALAQRNGVRFLFEATFMGGCPIYSLFRETLPVAQLRRFRGLPNGTTTVILEALEQGKSMSEGIRHAQALGIAETDPSFDVDGWDSAVKLIGLANVLMGAQLGVDDVERTGIADLDPQVVRQAKLNNQAVRLVASVWREGGRVRARVAPELLEAGDPLASVVGGSMLGHFETDVLPGLTLTAHDGDAATTAYDMLCDFVTATKTRSDP